MIPGSTNQLLAAGVGYQISRSVRLRSSASAFFNRTPASTGNRQTWTWSGWVKRGALGSTMMLFDAARNSTTAGGLFINATNNLGFEYNSATSYAVNTSSLVLRDPSAWYHIVCTLDTTQATATNRIRLYVNGVQITSFGTQQTITQNDNGNFNTTNEHAIGGIAASAARGAYFDGYLTEINFIDGQALTPSSFGETDAVTGVWKPKKYVGTYGTNGFYLNFSDNSNNTAATIGKDYSGNGNNWTPNNISVTAGATYDSMLDVPTPWPDGGNGRGNYAVLNPLDNNLAIASITNGNLQHTGASAVARYSRSTIQIESGKYYWEITATTTVAQRAAQLSYGGTYSQYISTGVIEINGSSVGSGYATWAANDVIGVALDRDNNTVSFYKNNTLIYTGTSLNAGAVIPQMYTGSTDVLIMNFGQRPFSYTPPSGFKALNTQNLPTPTILKGNQYFDATLWTGTGSAQSITNSGSMQPDLVIVKSRSYVDSNYVADSVRGSTNLLQTNATAAELNASTAITAFSSNGFSLGSSSGVNTNAATYVGWQWKEGATQGFDIVTYTGNGANRTIAHNLGVAPKMIILKARTGSATDWYVYHANANASPATGLLYLNLTNAFTSSATAWNNTAPTSSVFSLGTASGGNANTINYVAYLFAEVAGFSRFGSYTGNGSADGPFVFCGFRPRYILIKISSAATDGWTIQDTARAPNNVVTDILAANSSVSEATLGSSFNVDILSNGFKIRNTTSAQNTNGATYIFAAFAENPTKYALAR